MQTSAPTGIAFGPSLDFGVTSVSRRIFDELLQTGSLPSNPVTDSRSWRRNYTRHFASVVPMEFEESPHNSLTAILQTFTDLARFANGAPLWQHMLQAWDSPDLVQLREITGQKNPEPVTLPDTEWSTDAARQVGWGLAEAALVAAAKQLDDVASPIDLPPLIAFAGGAELSAVPHWLRWGGDVLLLARTSGADLEQLEQTAKSSSARLWVVVDSASGQAGIDLVAKPELAAAALSQFVAAQRGRRFLFGHFGYAPGFAHLQLEAVAQALTELLVLNVPSERLQFSWLATPTDSLAVPLGFAQQRLRHWQARSGIQRVAALPWRAIGYLRPPHLAGFTAAGGEQLAILDSAARLQGPSYSLAKRLQRWRAHTLRTRGALVSYQITPPARTDSVLRHKMLRATYRGCSRFGLYPFDSYSASIWPAALSALDSLRLETASAQPSSQADWYFSRAIHGGLWRTQYEASSVWVPATVVGLFLPKREESI